MERQLPRNVRQIGNVSDNPKIYVEDYVDTFLTQLCQKAGQVPVGAFFIGESIRLEEQDCIFISGAVEMEELTVDNGKVKWGENTWKAAKEECKEYFGERGMIGWFLCVSDPLLTVGEHILRLHERRFSKGFTCFVLKNPVENEEIYYAYKYKDLMRLGGHYIYYEKNPAMQNYLIRTRARNGVSPLETYEDRAAQDFRNIVRERLSARANRYGGKLVYLAGAFLVLIILVVGITTIHHFDRMNSVQSSLEALSDKLAKEQQKAGGENPVQESHTRKEKLPKQPEEVKETANEDAARSDQQLKEQEEKENRKRESQKELRQQEEQRKSGEEKMPDLTQEVDIDAVKEVYIVQPGDTLDTISRKIYGTGIRVKDICAMNHISDGNLIYEGQKLWLPE